MSCYPKRERLTKFSVKQDLELYAANGSRISTYGIIKLDTNESSVVHCIETKGPPVHARTRRLNPEKLAYLKREFGDLMRQGIIRLSKSSYASPIHFVKKSDGSWRNCGDFRRLNSVSIPDRYPLPHIHDFVSGLRASLVTFNENAPLHRYSVGEKMLCGSAPLLKTLKEKEEKRLLCKLVPRSEVILSGTPNREIHPSKNVRAMVSAV
ncbi:retrovirus-related Pol polyprotein from transposon opus [Trichonephila clavipes]|nr:retrovirus-related Pol polyprotein from transposon opus [Trichonephila clavipes]